MSAAELTELTNSLSNALSGESALGSTVKFVLDGAGTIYVDGAGDTNADGHSDIWESRYD